MPVEELTAPSEEDLEEVIQRNIARRTWGRLHRLRVEVSPARVLLQGCTSSYHVVQLAILAIQEVHQGVPVELDIHVGGSEPRPR